MPSCSGMCVTWDSAELVEGGPVPNVVVFPQVDVQADRWQGAVEVLQGHVCQGWVRQKRPVVELPAVDHRASLDPLDRRIQGCCEEQWAQCVALLHSSCGHDRLPAAEEWCGLQAEPGPWQKGRRQLLQCSHHRPPVNRVEGVGEVHFE